MDLNALQPLAIALAEERDAGQIVQRIVAGLADIPGIALARIWLLGPGDQCASCPMRSECPDQTQCLHLVASEGGSRQPGGPRWNRLDGSYRRFPLGVRKVGRVAAERAPALLRNVERESDWMKDPAWGQAEGIRSFAGQPLLFRGELVGVLGVFSRLMFCAESMAVLRGFADHAAAALANARAFEEIERLRAQLAAENAYLRREVVEAQGFGDIIGRSPGLEKVLQQIRLVAPTESAVLLLGESGTGKELAARTIHTHSSRAERPLVTVNCASIPRELFESEFFGHVKGAFTGAVSDRLGRFALADGGTLFLDEVGELPLELQGKLLRVLQEGRFERIGEGKTRRVDVRIVAATNRDLLEESQRGGFRADLYYRLSVFPITLPPLRARREDILPLAEHFLAHYGRRHGKPGLRFDPAMPACLERYPWPGNIRELQNAVERAVIMATERSVVLDLPCLQTPSAPASGPDPSVALPAAEAEPGAERIYTEAEMAALARRNFEAALARAGGKISGPGGAAERLGLHPNTLTARLRKLGLR